MENFLYLCAKSKSSDYLLYWVNRCGATDQVGWDFDIQREHAYPYCVIHYVTAGNGSLFYKGREYSVKAGQLFILDAFEAHRYRTDPIQRLTVEWIEFTGGDALRLVRGIINANSPVVDIPSGDDSIKYLQRIFKLLHKDEERYSVLISELLYKLLLKLLFINNNVLVYEASASSTQFVQKISTYIEEHLDEELPVERLSKLCSFDPSYFTRLFHKTTGMTPAKFVLDKRIEKARRLLAETDKPVEQISDELCFCNASHFIRVFKKAEGMTPAEYRKQGILYKMYVK